MSFFKYDLVIDQGATFTEDLTWKTGKPALGVDMSGCQARIQFREEIGSTAVLYEMTTQTGEITLGMQGEVHLEIDAVTTAGFTFTDAVYDLEIVFPNGFVKRLTQGKVKVTPEVTRG